MLLKCYFLRLVVAAFLALVVAAVLLFLKKPTRHRTNSGIFFSGSRFCFFVVVVAVAAQLLWGFVVWVGNLV